MDQARLVLDYLDVLIWPMVVAGVIALLVLKFRAEIAALIDRIKWLAGPFGTGALMREQQTVETAEGPAVVGFLSDLLTKKESEITLRIVEVTNLTQQLALYQIYYSFERAYRTIFGTQIILLQRLSLATDGADLLEIMPQYESHLHLMRLTTPAYDYPFPYYLGFLQNFELIEVRENRHFITEKGRAFLYWMNQERVILWKPN